MERNAVLNRFLVSVWTIAGAAALAQTAAIGDNLGRDVRDKRALGGANLEPAVGGHPMRGGMRGRSLDRGRLEVVTDEL